VIRQNQDLLKQAELHIEIYREIFIEIYKETAKKITDRYELSNTELNNRYNHRKYDNLVLTVMNGVIQSLITGTKK
jgi:hypothetical protein